MGRQERHRVKFPAATEAEAEAGYNKLKAELEVEVRGHTCSTCLAEYLAERKNHEAKKTYDERLRILKGPIARAFGHLNPDNITRAMLISYQNNRLDEIKNAPPAETKLGNSYSHAHGDGHREINLELIRLRQLAAWMQGQNYCIHDLPACPALPYKRKKPITPAEEVILKVIEHLEPLWRHVYTMVYFFGLRQDEIKRMVWGQVLWGEKRLIIIGKREKTRVLPFHDLAWTAINEHKKEVENPTLPPGQKKTKKVKRGTGKDDLIFPSTKRRKPTQFKDIRKALDRAIERAALELHLNPHAIRHTFATQLHKKGHDIVTIQGLLGHEDIATTRIYLEPDEDLMNAAIQSLGEKTTKKKTVRKTNANVLAFRNNLSK
jgi:site-specific recombinase XerD